MAAYASGLGQRFSSRLGCRPWQITRGSLSLSRVILSALRKGERRDAWAAFLTLFAIISSHSILETARDALFLAKVPATQLPWVFLAIAALSFAVVRLQALVMKGRAPERALAMITSLAALGTFGFYWLYARLGAFGLYALYVWSGLLATMVLVHFWASIADRFTITQGKRLYGFIGAGSVLGAIAGSGTASLLSRMAAPEQLLLAASVGFAIASAMPMLFAPRTAADHTPPLAPHFLDTVSYVAKDPYAYRVAACILIATVCLTIADFVFKSTVAGLVPKEQLGMFLGMVYFSGNVLSLVCQLGVVAFVLKRVSLGAALAVLPTLIALGGLGVAVFGGLFAVLALKTTDGALRYSLHRTAAELLFLPFGEEPRRQVKVFVDVVGQRGGQVLAACAILAFTALGTSQRVLAFVLAGLACGWVASAIALRTPYIELFRSRLKAGRSSHIDAFPDLDVASLEGLLAALESHNDNEVIAALEILDRENKAQLIPALILYHPSEEVVLRALQILTQSRRQNCVRIIDRVLDHPSPVIRAATVAARSVLAPDLESLLLRLEREDAPSVRAAIVANLLAAGHFEDSEREKRTRELLERGSPETQVAFAEAIGRRAAIGFEDELMTLAGATDLTVKQAAITAMGRVQSSALLPVIIGALVQEETRRTAEHVLMELGPVAFEALRVRFEDVTLDPAVRWRIPAAMAMSSPSRAMQQLVTWLPTEPDGSIRYQIVRTIARLVAKDPGLPFDRAALERSIAETVSRAYRYLNGRTALVRGAADDATRKTPGHDLLCQLLRDKEANARGRLFRLLGVLYPSEDFGEIHRGLAASRDMRATSMELIESVLKAPLRSAVLGLVDDGDDQQRLSRAGEYHELIELDYDAWLAYFIDGESDAVREVAEFHAAELGIEWRSQRVSTDRAGAASV